MNKLRHSQIRASRDLFIIASHLNATPLETVTAEDGPERRVHIETAPQDFVRVVVEEFRQLWTPRVVQEYRDANVKSTLLIPDLGPVGIVCVSAHRMVHFWSITGDPFPPNVLSHQPVDADILTMGCVTPKAALAKGLDRKLLALCYPREVGLYWLCYQDGQLHLSRTGYAADIQNPPSAVAGGCDGRIFIGTLTGEVLEFHYGDASLLSKATGLKGPGLRSLGWVRPNGNAAVDKLRVDSVSKTLIVLSDGGALALYSLGDGITTQALRRASYSPSHFLGSFGSAKLLDVLPMDPEEHSFQGMCVFEDGGRMRLSMRYGDSVAWDAVNWAVDGAFRTTTEWTRSDKPIPVEPLHGGPQHSVTHIAAAADGTSWLVCEQTGSVPTLSLLQFIDAKPNRRIEGGGVYFRSQLPLRLHPVAFATYSTQSRIDFTGFERSTDFISQQFAPAETRHIVLDPEGLSIILVKSPIHVLSEILSQPVRCEQTQHLKTFGKLYGTVEMAALVCLCGIRSFGSSRFLGRSDLFDEPRMIQRRRDAPAPASASQSMTSNLTTFTAQDPFATEEDIEFSDAFKGLVLILRQVLKPLWWKRVMSIGTNPVSQELHAEVALTITGLDWTLEALESIQTIVGEYVRDYDPRVVTRFIFGTETQQIEIHEMMALLLLMQRCREAILLLGVFRKRSEIVSIVSELTQPQRIGLNDMTFNHLVFAAKAASPFTPFLKAALERLDLDSTAYAAMQSYITHHTSTFWNQKDANEYEAMRRLAENEKARVKDYPIDSPMYVLNGAGRDRF